MTRPSPAATIAFAGIVLAMASFPALARGDDGADPNLDQTLAADEPAVRGERVLDGGHVDMGPKLVDGAWSLLIHDDAAKTDTAATSVWRYPAQTVLHVLDQASLTVPDDPAYAFVGADAGEEVWVVPQTQNPDVVWLGWNTQDPWVAGAVDRGITLSLVGIQGPGVVTVYLQSGSFDEPQLLYDSRVDESQSVWVDVNTHTHANWVFTAPGVYLLRFTAEADLTDGSHVTDTQELRFAVGTATSPSAALAATWSQATVDDDAQRAAGAADGEPVAGQAGGADVEEMTREDGAVGMTGESHDGALARLLTGAIGAVAALLVAGFGTVALRARAAKRQVLTDAGRTVDGHPPPEDGVDVAAHRGDEQ
ncbi:MAG: choice-of-anchor M domain-containing protein [Bifidobacteriaceae bacterium]|nr:choice-of-anchor M domain-containing protein [Bifidobacteriaceae bacterium]